MPTDERHFPIVESSKAWRKDMRTYVALSNETLAAKHAESASSQEIWGYYPDDKPLKGLHPGDTRAGLTPFLAHEVCDINHTYSNTWTHQCILQQCKYAGPGLGFRI